MAASDKDRQVEPVGKLHWALIALVLLMTLVILALAVRIEKAGPVKPDRNRIFDHLKSSD